MPRQRCIPRPTSVMAAASTKWRHGLHGQDPLGHGQDPPGGTGKTAPLGPEPSGLQRARPTRGACPARTATCPSPQPRVDARREASAVLGARPCRGKAPRRGGRGRLRAGSLSRALPGSCSASPRSSRARGRRARRVVHGPWRRVLSRRFEATCTHQNRGNAERLPSPERNSTLNPCLGVRVPTRRQAPRLAPGPAAPACRACD
jgi:hypothetical protein